MNYYERYGYPARFCLFCDTATDETAIDNARAYIRDKGLTSDDVRIRKTDDTIEVWTKRDGVKLIESDS